MNKAQVHRKMFRVFETSSRVLVNDRGGDAVASLVNRTDRLQRTLGQNLDKMLTLQHTLKTLTGLNPFLSALTLQSALFGILFFFVFRFSAFFAFFSKNLKRSAKREIPHFGGGFALLFSKQARVGGSECCPGPQNLQNTIIAEKNRQHRGPTSLFKEVRVAIASGHAQGC